MVNVLDCSLKVSEFEFQSRYYVHFRTNPLGKGMNSVIPPATHLNSITAVLFLLIIIKLRRKHRFPWLSLSLSPSVPIIHLTR